MQADLQGASRQIGVGAARGSDDHQVEVVRPVEDQVDRVQDLHLGVLRLGLVATTRVAGHHRGQLERRIRGDEGGVEDPAGQTEPEDSCANGHGATVVTGDTGSQGAPDTSRT